MALGHYYRPVIDGSGNIVTGLTVEVKREVSGSPLGVPYSDREGVTSKSNPFTAADGVIDFYAVGGSYSVRAYKSGYDETWNHVAIGTAQEADIDALLIPGYLFEFETGTSAPPTAGCIRANGAANVATRLYVSQTNIAGSDLGAVLADLVTHRALLTSATAGEQASWDVSLATDQGTYYELVISGHVGATSVPAGRCGLQREGATGATGNDGVLSAVEVTLTGTSETLLATHAGKTILLNNATGMTLAAEAAATLGADYLVLVRNIGTAPATLDPDGAETIDGAASLSIPPGASLFVGCNGTVLRSYAMAFSPIPPSALSRALGIAVESTLTAPPGSPATGLYYLVGTSATGAWSGKDAKVATWDGVAWQFIDPYEGAVVWHKTYFCTYAYSYSAWAAETVLVPGVLSGLKLANNGSDATNDIDIAAGSAVDDTGTRVLRLASGITKRLDASWAVGTNQGGRDTGSITDAWWYVWLIGRSDTGVVDVLFSQSATAPTMPTNYTHKVRIGEVYRTSSALKGFVQHLDDFWWKTELQDAADSPATSSTLKTLTVPPERCLAYLAASAIQTNGSGINYVRIHDPDLDDFAPSSSNFTIAVASDGSRDGTGGGLSIMTDSSGRVRHRSSSAFTGSIYLHTRGWRSRRGKPV